MAAERGATGLWQRGGYECSCSGASHLQRTLGRWQAASAAEPPRRQRRAARILTVCMARGARLAVDSVVLSARFPRQCFSDACAVQCSANVQPASTGAVSLQGGSP